ncbi:MAG: BACON domain-containing carbohydrate-binding protein [Bacteroidota bacterium]
MNRFFVLLLVILAPFALNAQVRILFNATKAETASNADWTIDADLHNLGFSNGPAVVGQGSESNPQQFPTPAQSTVTASTPETYWSGGISAWGIDMVKKGYTVETLPYNGSITYGNSSNPQDLSNYKVFIDCEPNILYTTAEKTAIIQFVQNGGGLFMVSDHTVSDRNNDGADSPMIWNDLMSNNGIQANPFGITFDLANFSQTTTNIPNLPADPILHGVMGDVTSAMWSNGTSMTLSTAANSSVLGIIYKTGSAFGNTNVMFSYASYGSGKVAAIGDSSPCDDGTGDSGDQLYNGWTADAGGNHERLIMNATLWLATSSQAAPTVTTLAASAVTGTSATLNGSVNPNGAATNYHFEWGTSVSYGNSTAVIAAGSGSAAVNVSANISSLIAGTTYHFRLVGVNSGGTTNGVDLVFTPGAVNISTTAVTAITLTGANSGGIITSDGGSGITSRGVCWNTAANPTTANSHTSDGSGTGSFSSAITGLTASTIYHVRAYATNSAGTFYGNDAQFTTLCAIYTLPFTENFTGTSIPGCWSQVDHQGNGEIWAFGAIAGVTPLPTLTGNYAFLNSDGYGSGNSQNADLVTPTLDLSAYSAVNLQFSHYFKSYTGNSGTLSSSIDNGSTWTLIATFNTTSATNPAIFSQAISAVAGQSSVRFKWNYTGTYGYYWAIDNVSITGTGAVTLSVTPANQNVTSAAGTSPFTVTTSAAWTATSNSAWCTVTPSGTGNGILTATFTQNTGITSRTANIIVAATGAAPVTVTVTQAGASPTLSVTPSNQNVTAPAGNTTFTVTSNSAWTTGSDAAWCTLTTSGSGNGTITATYSQNTVFTSRTANITVAATGATSVIVTVTQAGASPTLTVTPPNQNVSTPAGNTTFTVTSNSAWTAGSDAPWCAVTTSGSGNGSITATYTQNTQVTGRIANITVTVTGLTPILVTVTQAAGSPVLTVTPANQNVSTTAGNTTFAVSSNSTWTTSSNAAWCTVTPSGTGDGTLVANFTANTLVTSRIATITVTAAGLTPVAVTVTQSGTSPTLLVAPANQNVPSPLGNTSFTVTSNSAWTASSDASWCTVTPSGTGNGAITASYQENTSSSGRTANISVVVAGLPAVIVTVNQAAAAFYLAVDPNSQSVSYASGTVNFAVSSNLPWTTSSNSAWCTVTTSGNGNGTLVASFSENTLASNRTASITVNAPGVSPVIVSVIQLGPAAVLSVTPLSRTVSDSQGSTTFNVTSNTTWTCSSDANWCLPTLSGSGTGLITATYQQNLSPVARTANMQVIAPGLNAVNIMLLQLPSFVSVPETPKNTFLVYPNPTNGKFIISSAANMMVEMKVSIINPEGKIIYTRKCTGESAYTFNLTGNYAGIYFIKIETDELFYELLVLVDAIRQGRPRERNLAIQLLKERLNNG